MRRFRVDRICGDDGNPLDFVVEDRIDGVSAGLHIGFFETEFPDLDEATLQVLVKKHCSAIANAMLEGGAAAVRRLFHEEHQ